METSEPHNPATSADPALPPEEAAPEPILTPNDELAAEITQALSDAGFLAHDDLGAVTHMLSSGTARPEEWRDVLEAALFPPPAHNDAEQDADHEA